MAPAELGPVLTHPGGQTALAHWADTARQKRLLLVSEKPHQPGPFPRKTPPWLAGSLSKGQDWAAQGKSHEKGERNFPSGAVAVSDASSLL